MNSIILLFSLPLWAYYVGTVLLVILSIRAGFQVAVYRTRNGNTDAQPPINTGVGSLLGLLAFILAFTFGLSMSRFEARKNFLMEEVNTLEAAYLRTDFLPEPYKTNMRKDLRTYVDLRVEIGQHPERKDEILAASAELRKHMWSIVDEMAQAPPSSVPYFGLFSGTVGEIININNRRVTVGLINELPDAMWLALYLLTCFAMMGFGYLFGMGGKSNWPLSIILAFAYSALIVLIVDLDKSANRGGGIIRVSNEPVIELQQRMSK
ncbi:MAG: hypothetical protein JST14_01150 [Bacteroidetes bacterium]|nr:hypothetical protein [Bacteroidota bacterium]